MNKIWINVYMITCAARKEQLAATLENWLNIESMDGRTMGVVPIIVSDTDAIEAKGLECDRPQSRQEMVSRHVLEMAVRQMNESEMGYMIFLEDDLEFNLHLWHNLTKWAPLCRDEVTLASLYNPNIREVTRNKKEHWFIAEPEAIYGSQAFLISKECATYILQHWEVVPGMQDIKFSRLAARMGRPIYYHTPSLVQHAGRKSAWTTDDRFHQADDFNPEWKA